MNTPKGGDASSSSVPSKTLPVQPSLEHLQKQAKRLVKQNPALKLARAQHQLALEYGCKNWAELARMVEQIRQKAGPSQPKDFEPLPKAARYVDIGRVREILQDEKPSQHDLNQALAFAIWYATESDWPDRKAIADLLIEHDADPNGEYKESYGPIVFGTGECLQPDALQYLVDAGADVTTPRNPAKYGGHCIFDLTLGTYNRGRNERKHKVVDILLAQGAFLPPEVTPELLAIHRGDAKALAEMLDADPGLKSRCFPDMPYGNMRLRGATLLHCAVEFGEIECAEELFNRVADINARAEVIDGIGGQTPLFHAINTNCDSNYSVLEYVVKRAGAWIDMSVRATWCNYGKAQPKPMTALEYAEDAAKGEASQWRSKIDEELVILRLLDHTEQIKSSILKGDARTVSHLLDERPDLLSPSLWPGAIFQARSVEITRLLLDRGLSPDECTAPRKPLHLAVYQCLPDIVELLVARGADANLRNPLGETPLDLLDAYEPRPVGDPDAQRVRVALLAAGATEDLYTIIRAGETNRLRGMLQTDPALARADSDLGGPLFVAARSGRPDAARLLLEFGADPNKVNSKGNTPLWFAAQSPAWPAESRIAVMKLLLEAGADIHHRCEDGTTALHFAAWRGPVEVVEFLLSQGARTWTTDDRNKTPADHAREMCVAVDKEEIVRLFSEVRILNPIFRSAVAAIDTGDVKALREILKTHPALIHQRAEEEGWFAGAYFRHPTLLHFVANNPYRHETMPPRILESTEAILEAGADINTTTAAENNHSVLGLVTSGERARKAGLQIPLIDLLVRHGADPSRGLDPAIVHSEMEAVRHLLHLGAKHTLRSAAAMCDADALQILLKSDPSESERTEAAAVAAMHGRIATLEILLGTGVPINARIPSHPYSPTLLHQAAWFGHRKLAERLVALGADLKIRDTQFNGTPAGWAEHNGHPELAVWLRSLESGSSENVDQLVVSAVRKGKLDQLKILLDAHPEKLALTGGPWNKPLLHNAAWEGHLEIVRELVGRGADVNERCESDHACAIHFAAEPGHLDVVRFLVDAGSVIEAADNDHQQNVLGWATSLGSYREDVARFLISRGANITIWSAVAMDDAESVLSLVGVDPALLNAKMSRNEYFRSPLHHAVSRNRLKIVRVLLELGADPDVQDALGLSVLGAGNADTDSEILALLEAKMEAPNLQDLLTLGRFDRAEALLAADPDCIKAGGSEARLFAYAVCRKNWPVAEWLLDRGADINAITEVYQCPATALHFAIECAPLEKVQWLLQRGAETTILDGTHHADALGWAEFFGKEEIAALITQHRATSMEQSMKPYAPYLATLEGIKGEIASDLLRKYELQCFTGEWLNSAVLKIQKESWTDGGPGQGVFFSVWLDAKDLKKSRFNYNIHALKLRSRKGFSIFPREFAEAFREKLRKTGGNWPNVKTDCGPQTLMQGWLQLDRETFREEVLGLVDGFIRIHGIIDEMLEERKIV